MVDHRRSRLLKASAFQLPSTLGFADVYGPSRDSQDGLLVGRDGDIDRLTRLVLSAPLVFVTGPSGVGKSTLLRRGVARTLLTTRSWLPVYVDVWGVDWEEGPQRALADAVQVAIEHGLDKEARGRLALEEAITSANVFSTLAKLARHGGPRAVLIFDQLDDYQLRHWEHFIDPVTHAVVSAQTLKANNPFWAAVSDLISNAIGHCVFSVRNDAVNGLKAVQFSDYESYPVEPLAPSHVRQLIEHLTEGSVVANPDNGFRQLVQRVARDLDSAPGSHGVLPIRLRVVVGGLATLRRLTIADLERAGGVEGIEAAYLEERVRRAGHDSDLAMRLLLALVDAQTSIPDNSRLRTSAELSNECAAEEAPVSRILEALARDGVVRLRQDGPRRDVWQLRHGYLAIAVTRLEQHRHRWANALTSYAEGYDAASGLAKFQHLLPGRILLRLAWERLRGRLRLATRRSYVLLSSVRLVANPLTAAACCIGLVGWIVVARETGRNASVVFDEDWHVSETEKHVLWQLRTGSTLVRLAALDQFLSNESGARRFLEHRRPLSKAFVEFQSPGLLSHIVRLRCSSLPSAETQVQACLAAAYFTTTDRNEVSKIVGDILRREPTPRTLAIAAWLWNSLDTNTAHDLQAALLTQMRFSSRADIAELMVGLGNLHERVDRGSVSGAIRSVLSEAAGTADDYDRSAVFESKGALLRLLADVEAEEATLIFRDVLDTYVRVRRQEKANRNSSKFSDSDLEAMTELLRLLAERVAERDVINLIERLLSVPDLLEMDDRVLAALAKRCDPTRGQTIVASILSRRAPSPLRSGVQRDGFWELIAMTRGDDFNEAARLIDQMGKLVDQSVVDRVADLALKEMATELGQIRDNTISYLSYFSILHKRIDATRTTRAWKLALPTLLAEDSASRRWYLASPEFDDLTPLFERLDPSEVTVLASRLADELAQSERARGGGSALGSLLARLPRGEAETALFRLVNVIGSSDSRGDSSELRVAVDGFAKLRGPDSGLFRQLIDRYRNQARPPCATFASLADRTDIEKVVELVGWPTCHPDDTPKIAEKIARLARVEPTHFGRLANVELGSPSTFRLDRQRFSEWVVAQRKSGNISRDLKTPPSRPF